MTYVVICIVSLFGWPVEVSVGFSDFLMVKT
jgi:hypothetical protein